MSLPLPSLVDPAFWRGRRVVVTGGSGFIGSHVVERLLPVCGRVVVPTRRAGVPPFLAHVADEVELVHGDLAAPRFARQACRGADVLLSLAAHVGGIGYNQAHPGTLLRENLLPYLTVLEAARLAGVQRVLVTSSTTVYPREAAVPTPEAAGLVDVPEPTSAGYGWAKRLQEVAGAAYASEFGLSVAVVRPSNAYGPRDDFSGEAARVVPSLLRKALDPQLPVLEVWGSGRQVRSFLYVTDAADAIVRAAERAPGPEAINVDSDQEVTIGELAHLVAEVAGTGKPVRFLLDKPEGQVRRHCDLTRQHALLDFRSRVPLRDGLAATVAWYRHSRGLPPGPA